MKIILTIDYSPWSAYGGGAQRSTHNLATALARRGHDVNVDFTRPPWERVPLPAHLPYTVRWATFFGLRSRRNAPLRPLNAVSVARTVRSLLGKNEQAVVHSNGEEGGLIHWLRPRHRFGFISTPRHPRYPRALLENRRLSPLAKLRLAVTEGKYLMQGSAARHADLCVPPSAFAADLVRRAFGLDATRLRVRHNGFPEEFLSYEHDPVRAEDGPLVFFGRFESTKGVDVLVEALGLLGSLSPRTFIIGRGPEEQALRHAIDNLGLADRVHLLPWMTHDELGERLTTARMVVLPSREENCSLAVLSAMAVGAPVISTRVGGTPELIRDGETGLLVEPGRPDLLAHAIARLLVDPKLSRRLGASARQHVREELTWDATAEAFETLYNTLPAVSDQQPARSAQPVLSS